MNTPARRHLLRRLQETLRQSLHHAVLIAAVSIGSILSPASARSLDEMLAAHEFSVCAMEDDLPFSSRGNGVKGFHIDLAQAIADRLGVVLKVIWVPSREKVRMTNCDAMMGAASFDAASGSQPKSENRALVVSAPYTTVTTVLVTRPGVSPVHALADLKALHVAVPSGSVSHILMNDNDIPVWVRFRNDAEILEAVSSEQADAGVVSQVGLAWYNKHHPQTRLGRNDTLLTDQSFQFDIGIGLRRADRAMLERVNAVLKTMREDGTLTAILGQYGIAPVALPRPAK
ncbi:MAG: transporter substrate-binding domain-containing protein [Pseudomonadota bacterium]|nr:transporter substrate-binding domain-containing protein [Pseudomonadota bacterium]